MTKTRFETDLARHTVVGLDTAVLIYHLDDTKPYSTLTESAFTAIAAGRPVAVVSTISLAELLVKPYADNRLDRAAAIEAFLGSVPNVRLVAPPAGAAARRPAFAPAMASECPMRSSSQRPRAKAPVRSSPTIVTCGE